MTRGGSSLSPAGPLCDCPSASCQGAARVSILVEPGPSSPAASRPTPFPASRSTPLSAVACQPVCRITVVYVCYMWLVLYHVDGDAACNTSQLDSTQTHRSSTAGTTRPQRCVWLSKPFFPASHSSPHGEGVAEHAGRNQVYTAASYRATLQDNSEANRPLCPSSPATYLQSIASVTQRSRVGHLASRSPIRATQLPQPASPTLPRGQLSSHHAAPPTNHPASPWFTLSSFRAQGRPSPCRGPPLCSALQPGCLAACLLACTPRARANRRGRSSALHTRTKCVIESPYQSWQR
jgi:hypothetical protein